MIATTRPAPVTQPIRVPSLAWLGVAVGLAAAYLMLQENGALLASYQILHELFHDGRHALGVPCH